MRDLEKEYKATSAALEELTDFLCNLMEEHGHAEVVDALTFLLAETAMGVANGDARMASRKLAEIFSAERLSIFNLPVPGEGEEIH